MSDLQSLTQAGIEALRNGDAGKARDLFARATESGRPDIGAWLGMATVCRKLEDEAGENAALDKVLSLDRRNLRALILKGDWFSRAGDGRAATSFYRAALQLAAPPAPIPPSMMSELRRAEAACKAYAEEYEAHLLDHLARAGYSPGKSSRRFAQSIDLMLGKKQIYLQQPQYFYFPELPQIQFYPREQFPWLDAVEAATDDIRDELLGLLQDEQRAFAPYVEALPNRPVKDQQGMLNNPAWTAAYLWKYGALLEENSVRCPRTMRAMEHAPLLRIAGRGPSVMFSLMKPGAHIPLHHGFVNTRLICHLPLIVPGKCTFRVGNDIREWQEGNAWVFDDSMEHEAWNRSDKTRVILLFDVWRPELSEEERQLVAAMFAAIDAYGGSRPWNA